MTLFVDEIAVHYAPYPSYHCPAEYQLENSKDESHSVQSSMTHECWDDGANAWEENIDDEQDDPPRWMNFYHR